MAGYSQYDSSKYNTELSRIIQDINNGYRVLVIMRGLPGSGKSTAAKSVIQSTVNYSSLTHILSTDDYFKTSNGRYVFDVAKLSDAHSWNQRRANQYLCQGVSPIIIDNTNLEVWEMKPYVASGIGNGYIIKILEPKTPWAMKPAELARRNCHGVPIVKIKKMLDKFQSNITSDFLIRYFEFEYSSQRKPPMKRNAPEIVNKTNLNPLPTVKPASNVDDYTVVKSRNGGGYKMSYDLIDLGDTDDWVVAEPAKNIVCNGIQPEVLDSNDSWTDTWSSNNDNADVGDRSKPQRTVLKGSAKATDKLKNPFAVNWEPIGESLSNWENFESLLTPPAVNNLHSNIIVSSCEAGTNTRSFDINPANENCFKVLSAGSRDINLHNVTTLPNNILKAKLTLDKGVMTSELTMDPGGSVESSRLQSVAELKDLFSNIPEKYIHDVLDKCNGDVNWTVEILLDGKNNENFIDLPEIVSKTFETNHVQEKVASVALNTSETSEKKSKMNKVHSKVRKDKSPSEISTELKKQIEGSFQFSNDHYSDHCLKLKKKIHGEEVDVKTPSEDVDVDNEGRSSSESSDEPDSNDKVVSFRMGRDFFKQLDTMYGTNSAWDDNLEPIIHLPTSLVNQIHALWLESICNQIEVQRGYSEIMMAEDEELARGLEAIEQLQGAEGQEPGVANLVEIMDMEIALANYNNIGSQWKQAPEDLATKLTQMKLVQMFPNIEESLLIEIYNAHDNNFEQTFHVLLINTGQISESQTEGIDGNAFKKLLADLERDLLERASREKEKPLNPDLFNDEDVINIPGEDGEDIIVDNKAAVQFFRQQAQHHLNIRNENIKKAKEYMSKGMVQVAAYYSQIAALHKKKHEYANNLAASRLMQVSASGTDSYTLDLHSLYVMEALLVLDVFLDKHISELRERKLSTSKLFLITGRGRHSPGQQPRIKPAVKKRLGERGLCAYEINPGLLGVFITSLSILPSSASNNY
ncbi:uncharacterized protein LOC143911773 [Arctopsyche grandis]|uniref:uncharacterized protein LOC143911773 n=1 Tax=Arctopsyche grandis TaxID=121162 RepID=UPI00406D6FE7